MAPISSSTEENTEFEVPEFEVPKSFVSCLGSNETATCISVNIELPRSLYLNMQRDSQWQWAIPFFIRTEGWT